MTAARDKVSRPDHRPVGQVARRPLTLRVAERRAKRRPRCMTRRWATVREKMLARMVQKLDVLLAVRSSRSNRDARCVSRARPPTCSIANLQSGRTQNPGRRQLDRVGRSYAEPFERLKTARAMLATSTDDLLRQTCAGTSQRRSGTACRETGNRDTKHATRPASAEGNRASTSGVPVTARITILSAS